MATKKQLDRAIAKAERIHEQLLKLQAQAEEATREADRVLGSAMRQAVAEPRSKWAHLADVSVSDFYAHVVDDVAVDDVISADDADAVSVPTERLHRSRDVVDSNDDGASDFKGGGQGF